MLSKRSNSIPGFVLQIPAAAVAFSVCLAALLLVTVLSHKRRADTS
jgi:hypothetical protein